MYRKSCLFICYKRKKYIFNSFVQVRGDRPSYSVTSIPSVDYWVLHTSRKEEAQVGGEVGGSEVVGGPLPPPPTGKSCGTAPTDTCKHADSPPNRTHGARESSPKSPQILKDPKTYCFPPILTRVILGVSTRVFLLLFIHPFVSCRQHCAKRKSRDLRRIFETFTVPSRYRSFLVN